MRAALVAVIALTACKDADPPGGLAPGCCEAPARPSLFVGPEDKARVLARLDREPYATILARIQARADQDLRDPDPLVWDHNAHNHNAEVSQANALLAWLFDDADRARKARDGLQRFTPDFETHRTWDVNIRMPHSLMGYVNTWDILQGTPWFPEGEVEAASEVIREVNRKFFAGYLEDDFMRALVLGPAQNNHPIRTATAIGYVALAFPDDPDAEAWANWAFSELDYLWGPDGHYVQPDGGVSEGPFYYGFAYGVSLAFFLAAERVLPEGATFLRDCRNRMDVDPWAGHGCVDEEPFVFENPLRSELFLATADWSLALRLPSGHRPPLADGYFNPFNGGGLLAGLTGEGRYRWDWETNADRPLEMNHGADLTAHHLVWFDDSVPAEEPPWRNRFLPRAGHAVFRSDWGPDARWLLLVAEHGSARKTLHDHVDGTSFSLAAYGDYLLVDPGYHKPNELDNAVTAHADAHNVVLIDGQGAPRKGLLTDFGDADAWLENTLDGEVVAYAEARQQYQETTLERSVVFVDRRWFLIADRLTTDAIGPREHRWRLGGNAGYDAGGIFDLRPDGARWALDRGGVDVYLASTAPGLALVEPPMEEGKRPHVDQFTLDRAVRHHGVVDGVVEGLAPRFLGVLAPFAVAAAEGSEDAPLQVTPVDLGEAVVAWEIRGADTVDLAILREAGGPTELSLPDGSTLETDAELVVFRAEGPRPYALIARGSTLVRDGATLLEGDGPVVLSE